MAAAPSVRMVTAMVATSPHPTRPGRHPRRRGGRESGNSQVLGAVLVLGGIGWFLQQTGLVDLTLTTTLSCLLIALGVGLVLTARREGGGGLVVLGIALTVVLASTSAVDTGLLQQGAGERTFTPATADDLADRYSLGVGSLTLDLTGLEADELGAERVRAQMGVGELVVLLPPASELAVDIRAQAQAGDVNLFGQSVKHDGTNIVRRITDNVPEGEQALRLDLDVGLGTIKVVRPPAPR